MRSTELHCAGRKKSYPTHKDHLAIFQNTITFTISLSKQDHTPRPIVPRCWVQLGTVFLKEFKKYSFLSLKITYIELENINEN